MGGRVGGGCDPWGAMKWWAKAINKQVASVGAIFTSTYHAKQLNPWPNPSAIVDGVVNYNWLNACQGEMESFKGAFMDIRQSSNEA